MNESLSELMTSPPMLLPKRIQEEIANVLIRWYRQCFKQGIADLPPSNTSDLAQVPSSQLSAKPNFK
ncbi:unnamed protein product [Rhizoctonia solani]|uniref:Uncharacterized protein n=1 Tax=Rhizoctonia solani TaxID=456999 RepID=A0A8H2ZY32_9AGAM|nr:unnamed protein product [Rhizoctonia solani]CAE6348649.1 unnamed protein product [Rhizoctonia solani]CAE6459437.1 unnamed protein product [Rhizoctonia solani]